jgi:hypothetical protein
MNIIFLNMLSFTVDELFKTEGSYSEYQLVEPFFNKGSSFLKYLS